MRFNSFQPKYRNHRLPLVGVSILLIFVGFLIGWKNIPGYIKANLTILSSPRVWDSLFEKNTLETIRLDISFKNLQQIEKIRINAIKNKRLDSSESNFVKAIISKDSQNYDCKVRLKGDLPDHWTGEKFSLRVEMKGGALLNGMSRFSLQDPSTRMDTQEWLFLNSLRKEDIMAVRYNFINLILNGKEMGIYAIEEHFSKEMIEANNRREGVILRFNDNLVWKKHYPEELNNINWGSLFRISAPETRIKSRVENSMHLERQKETAINLLRGLQEETLESSKIFDVEKMGKFLALTHLWNAQHGLGLDDINFYFNPITCLLEPIGFDAEVGLFPNFCLFTLGDRPDTWVNCVLKDPKVAHSYIKYLGKFTNDAYIGALIKSLSGIETSFRRLLLKEFIGKDPTTIWKNAYKIFKFDPYQELRNRSAQIKKELNEKDIIYCFAIPDKKKNKLTITLRNTTSQPVEINNLIIKDNQLNLNEYLVDYPSPSSPNRLIVNPNQPSVPAKQYQLIFDIPLDLVFENNEFQNNDLFVNARFWGHDKVHKIRIPVDHYLFNHELLPIKLDKLHLGMINAKINNTTIIFKSAEYHISDDIFIPEEFSVIIEPGSILIFEENATFTSHARVLALGTSEKPIIFKAMHTKWPGLLIFNATQKSTFNHAKFSDCHGVGTGPNPDGVSRNGWTMTGGINIYNSDVSFNKCNFSQFQTEDALNIISSNFNLDGCDFSETFSDAFDGDFVSGSITDCRFSNIFGDGVDVSGSHVKLSDCEFYDIKDKAISVGEGSHVDVSTCKIDNVSFGLVSKDLSVTKASNITITDAKTAAFAAFQKKNSFGPASILVSEPKTSDCKQLFLIQDGSTGLLDDQVIDTSIFKTTDLY